MNDAFALPPVALHYLEQLRLEAASLPAAERTRLVEQIREHLIEAVAEGGDPDATVARLGHPRELVADADPGLGATAGRPSWQRVVLLCSIAAVAASASGALGMAVAIMTSQRALLLGPSRLLLAVGVSALVATGAVGMLLRRVDRTADGRSQQALRSRPLLAAGLVTGAAMLALGVLGCALAGLLLTVTGSPRATIVGALGLAVVTAGIVALVRTTRSLRSHGARTSIG
jgi:hypothetical protein